MAKKNKVHKNEEDLIVHFRQQVNKNMQDTFHDFPGPQTRFEKGPFLINMALVKAITRFKDTDI